MCLYWGHLSISLCWASRCHWRSCLLVPRKLLHPVGLRICADEWLTVWINNLIGWLLLLFQVSIFSDWEKSSVEGDDYMSSVGKTEWDNIHEIFITNYQFHEVSKSDSNESVFLVASFSLPMNSPISIQATMDSKHRGYFHLHFHAKFIALSVIWGLKYWVYDLPRAQWVSNSS